MPPGFQAPAFRPGSLTKTALLSQYAADLTVIEHQITTLLEQRSRLQALQSLVSKTQGDIIDALMEGRKA